MRGTSRRGGRAAGAFRARERRRGAVEVGHQPVSGDAGIVQGAGQNRGLRREGGGDRAQVFGPILGAVGPVGRDGEVQVGTDPGQKVRVQVPAEDQRAARRAPVLGGQDGACGHQEDALGQQEQTARALFGGTGQEPQRVVHPLGDGYLPVRLQVVRAGPDHPAGGVDEEHQVETGGLKSLADEVGADVGGVGVLNERVGVVPGGPVVVEDVYGPQFVLQEGPGVVDVALRIPDLRVREGPQEGLGEEEAQDGRQGDGDQANSQQGSDSQGHVVGRLVAGKLVIGSLVIWSLVIWSLVIPNTIVPAGW